MIRNIFWISVIISLILLMSGCVVDIDEEEFPPGQVQKVCVYPDHPSVSAGSGAFSLPFGDENYWIFNGTVLKEPNAQGEQILSNIGAMSSVTSIRCGNELQYMTDSQDQLVQIVPFTSEEQTFNAENPEGSRIDIWPIGGFVHDNVGWIYFQKVLVRGYLDFTVLGTGIAEIQPSSIATRTYPNVSVEYPTLLWLNPQSSWGTGAFRDDDGFVYLYGCFQQATVQVSCGVARVLPQNATDINAYEYYDTLKEQWISDPQNASVIFSGARTVSAGFNRYLDKYMIVYVHRLTNEIEISVADYPWGPFTESRKLFTGEPPAEFWIRDLHMHQAYQSDGKTLFLTYYSDPANAIAGMRLVNYKLY